jgi:acetyl esterase/lipase
MTGPLERGWVIALTDYEGLGTPGPHPYLVGESEGRAVLDSVLAAHELDLGLELSDRYAVWGHSQGGHAALFAGQLAPEQLPEHELVGVVALAPATRLADNLAAVEGTEAGNVLSIFAVESWRAYFPDIPAGTLTSAARSGRAHRPPVPEPAVALPGHRRRPAAARLGAGHRPVGGPGVVGTPGGEHARPDRHRRAAARRSGARRRDHRAAGDRGLDDEPLRGRRPDDVADVRGRQPPGRRRSGRGRRPELDARPAGGRTALVVLPGLVTPAIATTGDA